MLQTAARDSHAPLTGDQLHRESVPGCAARGKRGRDSAAAFLDRLDPEALAQERCLTKCSWRPTLLCRFLIHYPKQRTITAAPFADLFLHHALIDYLEPTLDAAGARMRRSITPHRAAATRMIPQVRRGKVI